MAHKDVVEAATLLITNQPITPPPLLWGAIGVGKSSFVESVAAALGYRYYQLCASHIDPAAVAGVPVPDMEVYITRFLPPEFLAQEKLLLFLDEINTAPETVVAAVMEVIRTRRLGGRVFGDLKIALAANPTEEAAGGFLLPKPLVNRLVHLDFQLPMEEFFRITSLPPHKRNEHRTIEVIAKIAPLQDIEREWVVAVAGVDGFLSKFPQHYSVQKPKAGDIAFPTPRSWDNAKIIIAVFRAVGASEGALHTALAGTVGRGVAAEFLHYISNFDMPDIPTVLKDVNLYLSLRADIRVALLSAIPSAVANDNSLVRPALQFAAKLEDAKRYDYAYLLAMRIVSVCAKHQYPIPLDIIVKFKHETMEEVKRLAQTVSARGSSK